MVRNCRTDLHRRIHCGYQNQKVNTKEPVMKPCPNCEALMSTPVCVNCGHDSSKAVKPFTSYSEWPDGTTSDDQHDTYEQAYAVCQLLIREGFGGDKKVFPTFTEARPTKANIELVGGSKLVNENPTQQQDSKVEELANELVDAIHGDISSSIREKSYCLIVDAFKPLWRSSLTATQALRTEVDRLKVELGEAQQWIDSEPDWKDKYMVNYNALLKERDLLKAEIVKKDEALMRVSTYGCSSCDDAIEKSGLNQHQHNAQCFIHNALSPTIISDLVQDKEILDHIEKLDKTTNLGIFYVGVRPPLRGGGMEGKKSVRDIIRLAIDTARKEEKK